VVIWARTSFGRFSDAIAGIEPPCSGADGDDLLPVGCDAPIPDGEVLLDDALALCLTGGEVFLLLRDGVQLDRRVQVFAF
jgi:hypothetical protein